MPVSKFQNESLGADVHGLSQPSSAAPALRSIPYPYSAMLAVCSDLDETPTRDVYWESTKYLNSTEQTRMGHGVGLEVGNTIYFDMPANQFSYWNTDDRGRSMLHSLMRSGHIDCLHSYGDFATTRSHAGRALDALVKHECCPEVWIDHAVAPTNFGADIMQGFGDVAESAAYHADLTCGFGVQYVWRGRVTSVVGQNTERTLAGIWSSRHPLSSTRTLAKEFIKGALARNGNHKYAIHAENSLLRSARLRDDQPVLEFLRSNPSWAGVSCFETADGVPEVITRQMLDTLVERRGVCVLYTHLGKLRNQNELFNAATRAAFELLSEYARNKKILITTTRRILGFSRALKDVTVMQTEADGSVRIDLTTNVEIGNDLARSDVAGLTVYTRDPKRTALYLNGRAVCELTINRADHSGRESVSIPWRALEFPLDA